MAAKKETSPTSNNVNNNANNVNVKVNIQHPKEAPAKKVAQPHWLKKAIITGLIGLALSLTGYYIKKNMDGKGNPVIQSDLQPVIGTKQTKN